MNPPQTIPSSPAGLPAPLPNPRAPARPAEHFPVIVIGGGPGGSAAAAYLARAGIKTLVLEKEIFPRFHIGESLLPYNRRLFEEMGVLPELEAAGFPTKTGAQFHLGNGSKRRSFVFRQGRFTRETAAFQVERAIFDDILLRHAAKCGADVRQGWTVCRLADCPGAGAMPEALEPGAVQIEALDPEKQPRRFQCAYVVDASGRANLTGNQLGLRRLHPRLKKLALFGHFKNVALDAGERGGDTVIVRMARRWFWVIPLSREKASVGCVMDASEYQKAGQNPSDLFFKLCQSSAVMRERMKNAEIVYPIQATQDFSYYNAAFASPGLLRVGDAAGFMDPIFSAGVYLAMFSGRFAARTLERIFRGKSARAALRQYDRRLRAYMRVYWRMVGHFYTRPFLDVFFAPRENFSIASAVNAALAGELEGGWTLRWRMELFFFLVWLQRRRPIVPPLDFGE